jgi:integrase
MAARKGTNQNHPKLGSIIKVEPIRDPRAIRYIKIDLEDHLTFSALFQVGINTAFRASDLIRFKVGDLVDNRLTIREQKTGKVRTAILNPPTLEAVRKVIDGKQLQRDDLIFSGQRGQFSVPYINGLVKRWCKDAGLKGNYGSHSLRKTFGFHQRKTFNVDLPTLMTIFNHANQRQTLTYLCIDEQEVIDCYANAI